MLLAAQHSFFFFFQAEDGIRDVAVTGVQTCALPIYPHIREALVRQAEVMPHVMFGGLVHEPALRLARRLVALLPGGLERVFFSESGSVAVEIALKMAVQFWRNQGRERTRLV